MARATPRNRDMSIQDLVVYVRKLRALLADTGVVPFLVIGPKRVEVKILRKAEPEKKAEAVTQ